MILIALSMAACGDKKSSETEISKTTPLPYTVRRTLEHDINAFTQGLVFYNNKIVESTGGDNSWIAEYDLSSGAYEKKVVLDRAYFGEGITVFNDKIYQLTWKSRVGFVYNARTYERIGEFEYDFEGWGITHDNKYLIISDGTDKLHYFDPETLQEVYTRSVKHYSRTASNLNELEFIEGFIYANQWQTNYILKIDTSKHEVVKEIDFGPLAEQAEQINPQADVLNGIAYNSETKDIAITGKLWPRIYFIKFK